MSNTIKDILQLHWMDGAKLSGGSYAKEPSLSADEALAEIERIIEEAKPEETSYMSSSVVNATQDHSWGVTEGYNYALDEYHNNLLKALEEV